MTSKTDSHKNAVKEELKAEMKALTTAEKYLSARQFILREMADHARTLHAGEDLTEGKGRRILAREVLGLFTSIPAASLPTVFRPDFSKEMTHDERVEASIVVMHTRIANSEARIARLEKVERATSEAAYRHLEVVFDASGREFAWRVIEAWENDPFTKHTRPGVPHDF